jgi:hypothetical protein
LLYVFARNDRLAVRQGIARSPVRASAAQHKEATMLNLPDDWFLYLAAAAMGLFMLTMAFVTIEDRRHP